MKKALITGITGQDGSYLAEFLLQKEYQVYGLLSRRVNQYLSNILSIIDHPNLSLIKGDMTDKSSLEQAVRISQPDEVYNLAAMSFVQDSWNMPDYTFNVNALGVQRLLDSVYNIVPNTKFYQASSSEQFGKVTETPQKETTPFYPRSPYGVSKCSAHWIATNYRESYNKFISCGILFNHTSPRRGYEFVEQKIVQTAVQISLGMKSELRLGNIYSCRDIGYSPDYIEAMWLMLQQDKPDDFVIATGQSFSIKQILEIVFGYLNLDWKRYLVEDENLKRPAEVDLLLGDSTKARAILGWQPKLSLEDILKTMIQTYLPNKVY